MRTFFGDAFFLARVGIRMQFKARETLFWTFVMPLVFIYFIGTVTGHTFGSSDNRDVLAVRGVASEALIARLSREYRVVRPGTEQEFLDHSRRLEISGPPLKLRYTRTGDDTGLDRVRILRAAYDVSAGPGNLTLDVKTAGKRVRAPTGFEQAVPGTMVMFTLLVMFTSGAVTLTIERRGGQLRRLASSPMARGSVVLGRWGSRMALGAVQIGFAMLAGTVLFHIHWGPNLPMVALILLAYGALAACLGMLLGNFGRTEAQVIGLGVLLSNVMAGLGGCWWPIEITPPWAQKAALFLPNGWTMDAIHKLVNFGGSPVEVLPHLFASIVGAVVTGWIVSRCFRFA